MSHKILDVYRFDPTRGRHQLVGSLLQVGDDIDILGDYFGYLSRITGVKELRKLQGSSYFRVLDREDVRRGEHPEMIRESAAGDLPQGGEKKRRDSIWEYSTPLLGEQPQILEWKDGTAHMNGDPLGVDEARHLLQLLAQGKATIRYWRSSMSKMEDQFATLSKIEPHLATALGALRESVKKGHVHPDVLQALSREIFVDPMVEGVGNKKAYADFLERPRAGVHIRMDGNDFGQINKLHSHEHGDQAIKAMGGAMREVMDRVVGRGNGKLFRIGGDEFHAHVPDIQRASEFARALREKMEALPPAGGTHNLSVSMGFGADPDQADKASLHAKAAKKAMGYPAGQSKMHAHSLLPGASGPVPVSLEQVNLPPLPSVSQAALPAEPASGGDAAVAAPLVSPVAQQGGKQ